MLRKAFSFPQYCTFGNSERGNNLAVVPLSKTIKKHHEKNKIAITKKG